ncbi:MAG: PVC-type heme-binding CxxCH protein [Ginsengibacter sp.]
MKSAVLHFFLYSILYLFLLQSCKNSTNSQTETTKDSTDKFADNVRQTPWLSPEEERKSFKLPDGFEITLFASEPDIYKPINMQFDERGRLWVTNTVEYPMPARDRPGRDRITILEDTDGDGKADKFTNFIDTLNIPIGITLIHGGAIAYSIPNVYKFLDNNNDDKADQAIKLLGPFGFEDTHGMVNNLVIGYDGWVQACHGYANTSNVAGSDGDSIHMNSGNTFSFPQDGSHVKHVTYGRVNPFGLAYDEWGYLYSLDCETKPIVQLIPGAQYLGQGVKEPSIGWAPTTMSYDFGATANSGLVYYIGTQFPPAYQHNFYSGNVVTSRINRNTVKFNGSSPESKREADFLISDDPWFRPVDIKMGPDGSMYVADFYNRIIGHYEVPKTDARRDRTSGRIWKITYTGNKKQKKNVSRNWSKEPLDTLIQSLNNPQLSIRMMIANLIVDKYAGEAIQPLIKQMTSSNIESNSFVQGLWILERLQALPENLLEKGLSSDDPMIQVHGLRILGDLEHISEKQRKFAVNGLLSTNPQVQRIALEVLGKFPQFNYITPVIVLYNNASKEDTHLKYTALLCLRSHLRNKDILNKVTNTRWNENSLSILAEIMPEVDSKTAALFAFNFIKTHELKGKALENQVGFISRYSDPAQLNYLIDLVQKRFSSDSGSEYKLYKAITIGVAQGVVTETKKLKRWGERMEKFGPAPSETAVKPAAEEIDLKKRKKIIEERISSYNPASVTLEQGKNIFKLNCTSCHHIGNEEGGSIGPNLSGIGTWGQRALTEKILDPNGRISTAFRTYSITMKNGKKLSGLYRREEGQVLVFANYGGEEFVVPKSQIAHKEELKVTLMPDQFFNTIAKHDFDALIKYLLSIKDKK